MRQVARQEFMRFIPTRFNIYYLAGIIFTGATISAILLTTLHERNLISTNVPLSGIVRSDTTDSLDVNIARPVLKQEMKPSIIAVSTTLNDKHAVAEKNVSEITHINKRPDTAADLKQAEIKQNLSQKNLFTLDPGDKNTLQSSIKSGEVTIQPASASGCAPFRVRFHYNSVPGDSCRWTFGDGGVSGSADPEWIFDIEGEYKVLLQVFRNGISLSSSTATVNVHPKPTAHFEIYPDRAILPKDEIHFLNFSTNAVQCKWDFGDQSTSESYEPSHTYSKFGNYNVRLVVYSDQGCSDSLVVFNAFSGSEYFIDFPNAFIPNPLGPAGGYYSSKSDEAAQVFHPSFSGVSEYQLKIFSKLGILIFESNDINSGWDGYQNGQLCEPGVYIWKVRGKFRNGEPFIKMGDVTLLKN